MENFLTFKQRATLEELQQQMLVENKKAIEQGTLKFAYPKTVSKVISIAFKELEKQITQKVFLHAFEKAEIAFKKLEIAVDNSKSYTNIDYIKVQNNFEFSCLITHNATCVKDTEYVNVYMQAKYYIEVFGTWNFENNKATFDVKSEKTLTLSEYKEKYGDFDEE